MLILSFSNAYDPGNPVIDFDKFFDGENLLQEDLVLWANLGMHRESPLRCLTIPHAVTLHEFSQE